MNIAGQANTEQATLWNGVAGLAWVELQALLEHVLKPFETRLLEVVGANEPGHLLDVGCGTGGTTLAAARALGARGHCTGVDISDPMIAAARVRAESAGIAADFICADAQTHRFEASSFDMIISRFGVMFFDDPVRAFANFRRAARDDAELCVIVWRTAAENPFMMTAERA